MEDTTDRSKGPWMPSYSVTVQKPETADVGQGLELEPFARRDVDEVMVREANTGHSDDSDIRELGETVTQPSMGLAITQDVSSESTSLPEETDTGSMNVTPQALTPSVESTTEPTENTSK